MISQKDAELVTRMLDKLRTSSRNTSVMATLRIASDPVNECSICQEGFHAGEEVLKLPCRHLYHAECVTSWLQQHNTCPLCRLQLPNKQQEQQKASGGGSDTSLYYN
jgi:E3 ubiquitin-protein ligase RNF115/126